MSEWRVSVSASRRATAGAWQISHAMPAPHRPGSSRRRWRLLATMADGCCRCALSVSAPHKAGNRHKSTAFRQSLGRAAVWLYTAVAKSSCSWICHAKPPLDPPRGFASAVRAVAARMLGHPGGPQVIRTSPAVCVAAHVLSHPGGPQVFRTSRGVLYQSASADGAGRSWTDAAPMRLPNPNSKAHALPPCRPCYLCQGCPCQVMK